MTKVAEWTRFERGVSYSDDTGKIYWFPLELFDLIGSRLSDFAANDIEFVSKSQRLEWKEYVSVRK